MRLCFILLFALLAPALAIAGPDKKQPKPTPPTPEEQAHALLGMLKNHTNEDNRIRAAEALAGFDGVRFFEVIPALTEALEKDSSPAVRRAAARSLGDVKPRSAEALSALEQAAENDGNWRVRQVAKVAKWGYQPEKPKQAKEQRETKKSTRPMSLPQQRNEGQTLRPQPMPQPKDHQPLERLPVERTTPVPQLPSSGGAYTLPPPPTGNATTEGDDKPILIAPGKK